MDPVLPDGSRCTGRDAVARAEQLVDLRERYRLDLAGTRSRAAEVVDLVMENPIISSYTIERRMEVTNQGARNLILQLQRRGLIEPLGRFGRGGRQFWVAPEVFAVLDQPRRELLPTKLPLRCEFQPRPQASLRPQRFTRLERKK